MKVVYLSIPIALIGLIYLAKPSTPIKTIDIALNQESISQQELSISDTTKLTIRDIETTLESNANCLFSLALKDWFDTHLNTYGEQDMSAISHQVATQISSQCNAETKEIALDVWTRYIQYKEALTGFDREQNSLKELRLEFFTPSEYDIWFSEEDQYDDFIQKQLDLAKRTDLTDEQKTTRLQALEQELPEDIQATRERSQRYGSLAEQVNEMRSQGKSDDEIFVLREEKLGTEAAENLEQLDQKRNEWKRRLAQLEEFQKGLKESGASGPDKDSQLELYFTENFSETEKMRAQAILGITKL